MRAADWLAACPAGTWYPSSRVFKCIAVIPGISPAPRNARICSRTDADTSTDRRRLSCGAALAAPANMPATTRTPVKVKVTHQNRSDSKRELGWDQQTEYGCNADASILDDGCIVNSTYPRHSASDPESGRPTRPCTDDGRQRNIERTTKLRLADAQYRDKRDIRTPQCPEHDTAA